MAIDRRGKSFLPCKRQWCYRQAGESNISTDTAPRTQDILYVDTHVSGFGALAFVFVAASTSFLNRRACLSHHPLQVAPILGSSDSGCVLWFQSYNRRLMGTYCSFLWCHGDDPRRSISISAIAFVSFEPLPHAGYSASSVPIPGLKIPGRLYHNLPLIAPIARL